MEGYFVHISPTLIIGFTLRARLVGGNDFEGMGMRLGMRVGVGLR